MLIYPRLCVQSNKCFCSLASLLFILYCVLCGFPYFCVWVLFPSFLWMTSFFLLFCPLYVRLFFILFSCPCYEWLPVYSPPTSCVGASLLFSWIIPDASPVCFMSGFSQPFSHFPVSFMSGFCLCRLVSFLRLASLTPRLSFYVFFRVISFPSLEWVAFFLPSSCPRTISFILALLLVTFYVWYMSFSSSVPFMNGLVFSCPLYMCIWPSFLTPYPYSCQRWSVVGFRNYRLICGNRWSY